MDARELAGRLATAPDASTRNRVAFDPEVIRAAAALEHGGDNFGLEELRRVVKGYKVSIASWDTARTRETVRLRDEEKRAAKIAAQQALAASVAANDGDDASKARERERAELVARRPDLEAHFAESERNDEMFRMEPGRMLFVETNQRTGERTVRELAGFSAVITEEVTDRPAPDQDGTRTFTVSIATGADAPTRTLPVPVAKFQHGEWTDLAAGARWLDSSRGTPRQIAAMTRALSHPVAVRRYGFTGWAEDRGRAIYVHAGGAIGGDGPVEGVTVDLVDPASRFRLPAPLEGAALRASLGCLRDLLARVAPAELFAVLLGAVFRAPLGETSCSIHIAGRTQSGKSTLAGIAQSFFGAGLSGESPPASWLNRSTTANGLMGLLNTVGDAVLLVDEFKMSGGQSDPAIMSKFSDVTQAHFNRTVTLKNNRDGSPRRRIYTRPLLLSTGEALPHGESLRSRFVCLGLDVRPTRTDGANFEINDLVARGASGEFAGLMAAYVKWLAAESSADLRARRNEYQREAAQRFQLEAGERTEKLLGALACGLILLGEFAEDVTGERWGDELARSAEALRDLALAQEETVAEENPARRFLSLLREACGAGFCHVAFVVNGRQKEPEAGADAWGWRSEGGEWKRRGPCIGAVRRDLPGEVLLIPGAALAMAMERGRAQGHPFPAARPELVAALDAIGATTRTPKREGDRGRVRHRIGGPEAEDVLPVKLSALFPSAGE